MCGIEILLCCAAGTAAGCCARHKLGEKGGKADRKKSKAADEHETYRRNGAAPAGKTAAKQRKAASPDKQRLQPRLTAYEEYQLRAQAAEKKKPQPQKSAPAAVSNLMDAEEYSRLQAHRQQKKQAG